MKDEENPPQPEDAAISVSLEESQQPDEAALIRQAQEGDRDSFERLYRLHSGRVYALCRRLSPKVEDAEELAQEVFVRAWQHMHHFQSPNHFSSWTRRVATNIVINERRTRARRGVASTFDETDATHTAEPAPASDDSRVDLENAITRVPLSLKFF